MPLRTSVIASRFRERQAELLKPLAAERVKAGKKPEPGGKLPQGKTRDLAASGTGYSGSSLDKVDKIRGNE